MGDAELRPGARYALKHTTRTVRATVQAVHGRLDMTTLEDKPAPGRLELNDIGRVTLRTSAPVLADRYADNRITGAFILIDEHTNDTVGAGMVEEARERKPPEATRRDVTWHDSELDRDAAVEGAGDPRRDGVADRAPGVGQVDDRRRARAQAGGGGPARRTCSTATTSATACPTTSASSPATAASTSAASPTSRGCSPTPAWCPSSRWCRPRRPTASSRASCTTPRASSSTRSTSRRRSRSASAATRRACTRRRARASCPGSPASTRHTSRPSSRSSSSTPPTRRATTRSKRLLDALAV